MLNYLLQRLATIIPTLFFVSVLIFGLQQLLAGAPATALAGEERDPEVGASVRARFHLDEPLPLRYWYWARGVLHGDLGDSVRIQKPVTELILEKLPVTIQLAAMAIVIALVIGISAGVVSAVRKDTWWDYAANVFALWGLSTPHFWLGILLILLFAVQLGWLPASGYVSPFEDLKANLAAMIMPAFVLGNAFAAVLMRHTRSAMLQVLNSDYVRTARAKGLDERVVILKHALRNALTPVITLGALGFGELLGGTVLTETVFSIPGFGKLIVDAVFNRDYAVVQGVVLVTATAYITLTLRADRHAGGLPGRLGRRPHLALHGCDACLPVPDPRDRAGGLPRAEPDQRPDRDRHLGDADLHPAHARAGDGGEGRGLCRGGAGAGQSAPAHRAAAHPAQHPRAGNRAGDAGDRRRRDRPGEAYVPLPGA